MGKDLYENFKLAREIFEEASDAARLNIKKLCFDGPDSELGLTPHTQPCLLTVSVAAFRIVCAETGFTPHWVAGHSLGEYSALVAAGAVPLMTAVRWVRERGLAMQEAVPAGQGAMAAVLNLSDEGIAALCERAVIEAKMKRKQGAQSNRDDLTVEAVLEPANFNAPGQTVIAGSRDALQEALALLKTAHSDDPFMGGRALSLPVSAPFHCSLMKPARARMAELFATSAPISALNIPYIPNRTARPNQETGLIFELLIEQIDHPVLWRQSMTGALENGITQAIEFGPGKVLAGLLKRIAHPLGFNCSLASIGDSITLREWERKGSEKS